MELNGVNFDTYFKKYPSKEGFFGKLKRAIARISAKE